MSGSRWSSMPGGQRPTRESLIPTMVKIIDWYQGEAYDELPPGWGGFSNEKLTKSLEKLPIEFLYLLHEVLVTMEVRLKDANEAHRKRAGQT